MLLHTEENIGNGRNYYSPVHLGPDTPEIVFQERDL